MEIAKLLLLAHWLGWLSLQHLYWCVWICFMPSLASLSRSICGDTTCGWNAGMQLFRACQCYTQSCHRNHGENASCEPTIYDLMIPHAQRDVLEVALEERLTL